MIDKADIVEQPYVNSNPTKIKPLKQARTEIIKAIMEPWLPNEMISFSDLAKSLNSLRVSRASRKLLSVMICTYRNHNGHIMWNENSLTLLKSLLFDVLELSKKTFEEIVIAGNPDVLRQMVISKTDGFTSVEVDEICHILTKEDNYEV